MAGIGAEPLMRQPLPSDEHWPIAVLLTSRAIFVLWKLSFVSESGSTSGI
jgi:hypothetical protein